MYFCGLKRGNRSCTKEEVVSADGSDEWNNTKQFLCFGFHSVTSLYYGSISALYGTRSHRLAVLNRLRKSLLFNPIWLLYSLKSVILVPNVCDGKREIELIIVEHAYAE